MVPAKELNLLTTLLPLAGIIFIIAIGVILLNQHFRKNLYRQMLEQEELKNKHQQDLLSTTLEVQEGERKRIAHDMHDELGAVLSIARMQLVQLEQQQQADKDLSAALQRVRITTEAALTSIRRLSHELMPPQLENFGLAKTLEAVCSQVNATGHISIELVVGENFPRWPASIELGLYRVCMEMINNTIKHAQAENIYIDLKGSETYISFAYADNGKGLSKEQHLNGLGFKSIEARVNTIGGSIELRNGKNGGFNALIEVRA